MTRFRILPFSLLLLLTLAPFAKAQEKPWPVKVVIVATFERGADTGDIPGEFQFWVEREHLTETIDFPAGVHPIRANADHSVIGIVTGMSLVNSTASVMALGLDPRFDLRSRYSIPSRVLDYMALGLPVVGTVHKASATGGFVRKLGLENAATCVGPEEIANWLMRLAHPDKWAEQSARSRDAFAYLERQEAPAQKLKRTMEKIG